MFAEYCQDDYIKEYVMTTVARKGEMRSSYKISVCRLKGKISSVGRPRRRYENNFLPKFVFKEKESGCKIHFDIFRIRSTSGHLLIRM
jgi:hypothetical protein